MNKQKHLNQINVLNLLIKILIKYNKIFKKIQVKNKKIKI